MNNKIDSGKVPVFHIVHGSFVDGHGVRTTVFLKGCPLRCLWCCNPEGQEKHLELSLTPSKCTLCGKCLEVCPARAISLCAKDAEDKIHIDRKLCTDCGKCIAVCYTGALDFFGKYMSVEEVFNTVKKDEQYYSRSGGGVTIGGGEPTQYPAFIHELLRKCRDNRLHVALDTCGYTLTDEAYRTLEMADLLLYDLKGMNPEEHVKNTGVSNAIILENLRKLCEIGKPVIIRMPLIPGYNDSAQNIQEAAEFLSKLKSVERVDILPYHKYGTVKYNQLGKVYKLSDVQTPPQEHIDHIKSTLERCGLKVQVGG